LPLQSDEGSILEKSPLWGKKNNSQEIANVNVMSRQATISNLI